MKIFRLKLKGAERKQGKLNSSFSAPKMGFVAPCSRRSVKTFVYNGFECAERVKKKWLEQ